MGEKIYSPHLSTASDARAVRTRAALRKALLSLIEQQPFERVTIRDIAATAGIGYTTFFRHHPTKEALLDDLAAEQIRELVGLTLPVMDGKSARAASLALFTHVDARRRPWSVLLTGGAAAALREEFIRIALDIAAPRVQDGNWRHAEGVTRLVVAGTLELLTWWLRQVDPLPIEDVAEIHHRVVIQPGMRMRGGGAPRKTAPKAKKARTR